MIEKLLNTTLRFSIARRWLIVAAAVVISLWGLLAVSQMPLDVFPPLRRRRWMYRPALMASRLRRWKPGSPCRLNRP